jgi:streptogramin lyase
MPTPSRLLLWVLICLFAVPAVAQASQTISEFPVTTADSSPSEVTAGADGKLWFTETSKDKLGRMSTGGTVTEWPTPSGGTQPQGITLGSDGNVWYTEPGKNKVVRMTPAAVPTEFAVTGGKPYDIAAGPGGNLWISIQGASGGIGVMTTSGSFSLFTTGITSTVQNLAYGPDGNIWFTEPSGDTIGRITPLGAVTEWALADHAKPFDIAAGPDGNVWFTEQGNGGAIGRITPLGAITEFKSGLTSAANPAGITGASDGHLYFAETAHHAIGKISTSGTITELATPTTSSAPDGVAVGPDGNVWYVDSHNPAHLGRLTIQPEVANASSGTISDTGATLSADIGAHAQSTQYWFEYGTTTGYGDQTIHKSAGSGNTVGNFASSVTGLSPSTTYHFRVVASNPAGTTYGADATFTTTASPPPPPPPAPPSIANTVSSNVGQTDADVQADVNPNGQATTSWFEYGTDTSYGSSTSALPAGSGSSEVSVLDSLSGLAPGTTYHVRAVASSPGGTTYGQDTTFTTQAPPQPVVANTAAANLTQTAADVQADVNPNGQPTTYWFEYGMDATYGSATASAPAGSGSAPVTVTASLGALTPGTTYHFRVAASGSGGVVYGPDVAFTTRAPSPSISNQAADPVAETSAELNADVNPNGQATTYRFEYGTDASYGRMTAIASAGSGTTAVTAAKSVAGLTPGASYHFRVVATSAAGTSYGSDATFTTSAPAAMTAPVTSPPDASAAQPPATGTAPKPLIGKALVADAVTGTVKVKLAGAGKWSTLTPGALVPFGTAIDASRGRLTFDTALPGGAAQTARMWGGTARMRQSANGMVDVYLAGPQLSCAARARSSAVVSRMAKSKKKPADKLIWVKDKHGRFRSHGQNSVATVRGTLWLTKETCAGTLTRVKEGAVAVRDLRRQRTVVVRAGHSYLARRAR